MEDPLWTTCCSLANRPLLLSETATVCGSWQTLLHSGGHLPIHIQIMPAGRDWSCPGVTSWIPTTDVTDLLKDLEHISLNIQIKKITRGQGQEVKFIFMYEQKQNQLRKLVSKLALSIQCIYRLLMKSSSFLPTVTFL